jgi:hypothetical protein
MKSIELALAAVMSLGLLSACNRPQPEAPAAQAAPAAEQPAASAPVPEPVAPTATDPVSPPATDMAPADSEDENDDQPQSGGDKVGTKPSPATSG